MTCTLPNPSIYMKFDTEHLLGLTENYVEVKLNAGFEKFQNNSERTLFVFELKQRVYNDFVLFGPNTNHTARQV